MSNQEIIFELECARDIAKEKKLWYAVEYLERLIYDLKIPVGLSFSGVFPPITKL